MAYTDEELRESLTQLADELGETPSAPQCRKADMTPSADTYRRRFGSWNAALKMVDLPINQKKSYTDGELISLCWSMLIARTEPTQFDVYLGICGNQVM